MIIVLKPETTEDEKQHLLDRIHELGLRPHISVGESRTIIGVIGDEDAIRALPVEAIPGVEKVIPILKPFKLVSREFRPEDTVIRVRDIDVGGGNFTIIAGPCSIENREMIISIARKVKDMGAHILRGGAFKPRTSPYSFQGLGEEGLKYLAEAREETGMPVITELMDPRYADLVYKYTDIIQIGTRNMQNFDLLKEVGTMDKPVFLKRGLMSTIKELLMSAEYIASEGNLKIILCERGIRTFEDSTRNTLDISAVPVVKGLTHLPIVIDPSHASGRRDLIGPLSRAAAAVGADGLMIEVHTDPEMAKSDGHQSLDMVQFGETMASLRTLVPAAGKRM
jgi:3-deoxy-7-phosphoheptulonate synthase